MSTNLQKAYARMQDAAADPSFWGSIVVQFQAGKPVIIRTERTEKLYETGNYRGKSYSR